METTKNTDTNIKHYRLNTNESVSDFVDCINDGTLKVVTQRDNEIIADLNDERCVFNSETKLPIPNIDDIINGKDKTDRIINIAVKDNIAYIYKLTQTGETIYDTRDFKYFVASKTKPNETFSKLKGQSYYNYIKYYEPEKFRENLHKLYKGEFYFLTNPVESFMMTSGMTYFKNLLPKDIPILSFDLETTTVDPADKDAKILCIGNTFRKGDLTIKRIFREDNYSDQGAMLNDWCKFVGECDPSILTGYNIYLFDIPYLMTIADRFGMELLIGRDHSAMKFETRKRPRQIRKDGSQSYDYRRPEVFGRDIVDMWIVTLKDDAQKKQYDSYALKHIIKVENLEKPGRVHYDASKIKEDWKDLEKRENICSYCMDDSEDPIKLFDLKIAPYFTFTSYLPKPLQIATETNSGGQVNSILLRAYLQDGWAIPKGDETSTFQGAISWGNPGIYRNVLKVDVASLYPSIMLQYLIKPKSDYLGVFLRMLEYLTKERLLNKKLAEETGNVYYKNLSEAMKIIINSAYGFLTAAGLNFNDLKAGSSVTRLGREVLEKAILWSTGRTFKSWSEM